MVKIKRINSINDDLEEKIYEFLKISKPYDFCEIKSPQLKNKALKEYIEELKKTEYIYVCYDTNDNFISMSFFSYSPNLFIEGIFLDFIFNDFSMKSNQIVETFYKVCRQVCEDSNHSAVRSEMIRKYKKNIYLKWLQRYDKKCKFIYQDSKIILEWHPYEW